MKTVEEITEYLEMELAEAWEMHDQEKGQDRQAALLHIVRAVTIQEILEEIKEG